MTGHGMLLAEQSRAEQSRAEQSRAEQTEFCIFVLPVIIYISINCEDVFCDSGEPGRRGVFCLFVYKIPIGYTPRSPT